MQNCKILVQPQSNTVPEQNGTSSKKEPPALCNRGSAEAVSPSAVWSTDLRGLVLPEPRKAIRRKRCVSRGRLQIAVPQIMRQRSGVLSLIGELVSCGMP
jgi:hypothetical protein